MQRLIHLHLWLQQSMQEKIDGFTCDMPSAKSILVSNPDLKIIDFEGGTGFEVSNEETDLVFLARKETQN